MPVFTALLHYPMYDKNKKVVCTSITNLDIHDIARSSKTYGIETYYIVNPLKSQQNLVNRMTGFWLDGGGSEYNIHRKEVFQNICPVCDFEEVKEKIRNKYNGDIKVLIPDARQFENSISYENAKELIKSNPKINYIIVFGTGYGLTEEFIQTADYILDPIYGPMNYNHLSVRSAAAIILDRLFGR